MKQKHTHTKGKWTVIPEQLKIVDEGDKTIASFCYGNYEKSFANARLAAKAPDMLEALTKVRDDILATSGKNSSEVEQQLNTINQAIDNSIK